MFCDNKLRILTFILKKKLFFVCVKAVILPYNVVIFLLLFFLSKKRFGLNKHHNFSVENFDLMVQI